MVGSDAENDGDLSARRGVALLLPLGSETPDFESIGLDPDLPLDFDALSLGQNGPHWELVGPFADLARASQAFGLDANAVRRVEDEAESEATLIHPSPFCLDPALFLSVLATLVHSTPHVRLYRVQRRASGSVAALVRVFPDPGEETLALLDTFHPDVAEQVRVATRMVADALAFLSDRSEAPAPDDDMADRPLDFRDRRSPR